MAALLTSVQKFQPESDNSLFGKTVYAINLGLDQMKADGEGETTLKWTGPALDPREYPVRVSVFTKAALDSTDGITSAKLEIGVTGGGALMPVQSFDDVSINTANDLRLYQSSGNAYTQTTGNLVNNGTLTTLKDSVMGDCTPQAITALLATSVRRVTTVNFNGVNVRADLTAADETLDVQITLTGLNFEDLTAGDLWMIVETETLPVYCIGGL